MALYSVFTALSQYWVRWWAEAGGEHMWFYMGIYIVLAIAMFISIIGIIS